MMTEPPPKEPYLEAPPLEEDPWPESPAPDDPDKVSESTPPVFGDPAERDQVYEVRKISYRVILN